MTARSTRAIGARLCLALIATVALCGQASADLVADSGFRPAANGYGFANYVNSARTPNLGVDEMRRLFGDAVCAGFDGARCNLSPPAQAWMEEQNAAMAGGHCFGISVSALLFWAKLTDAGPFGGLAVPRLKLAGNTSLARQIAYGHTFQNLASVIAGKVSKNPRAVVETLIASLKADGPLYTLAVVGRFGGGHAVTPYAVDKLAAHRYAILVYDNNLPGKVRKVLVDTKANTWSYRAAVNPNTPGSLYTGNPSSQSLFLLPTRPGLGQQPCAFCAPPDFPSLAPALGLARTASVPARLQSIRLQSSGRVNSHLLIKDAAGHRIGFVRGRLVNEIPGARVLPVLVGNPATWRDRSEPEYQVPTGRPYHVTVTAGRGRGRRGTSQQRVTVLGPGLVVAARKLAMKAGQRAELDLAGDGGTISVRRPRGLRLPALRVGNAAPGSYAYRWTISDRSVSDGSPITASLDVVNRTLTLTGKGTYDLRMDRVRNDVSVFTRSGYDVGEGDTVVFDFANWEPGRPMPVTVHRATDPGVPPQPSPTATPTPTPTGAPDPRRAAHVRPPVNEDGSSVFSDRRGVVPLKFTLTEDEAPTCALPPAVLRVSRTGDTDPLSTSALRVDGCKYHHNLRVSGLGEGAYVAEVLIDGAVVGEARFRLAADS